MASPVTASDFQLQNFSSDVCERLRKLLEINDTLAEFFAWFLSADGSAVSSEFKMMIQDIATPTGALLWRPLSSVPDGYLVANGQAVSRTTYANLFAVYGTTFGDGDESTTFNLPNMQAKFALGAGAGSSYPVGSTGGVEQHTLTLAEMPAHAHTYQRYTPAGPANDNPVDGTNNDGGYEVVSTGSAGSTQAHNNMPPYLAGLWLVKT